MDREQRLREIRERSKRDAEVWPMGSAEASFAGRFDTWQAMHCTEAVQCYQDREELLRIVEELDAALCEARELATRLLGPTAKASIVTKERWL